MGVFNAERWERAVRGEPHVVRFAAPHEEIIVPDRVLGDVRIAPGELDDFVLRKADGFPTYHFAVVVDDELMGVSHVLRAQEHLANTPRHVALQRAMGYATPIYGHMPLIFNIDKTKMSKRDKAKSARAALKAAMQKDPRLSARTLASDMGVEERALADFLASENDSLDIAAKAAARLNVVLPEIEVADFRANGYLPAAINNYLGLLGWNPGMKTADGKDLEKFDTEFLAQHFSIERIGKTNSVFDRVKLASFNGDLLAAMPIDEFAKAWKTWCTEWEPSLFRAIEANGAWALLSGVLKGRSKTLRDAARGAAFMTRADDSREFDKAAAEKALLAGDNAGLHLLEKVRSALDALGSFDPAGVTQAIETFARAQGLVNEKGVNVGPVAQSLRIAIAGVAVTPPLGETLTALGKPSVLRRIDSCLAFHRGV